MQEVQIGQPLTEFPGGSFNEMQRRIKKLEAMLQPRRRGGRGGGEPFEVAIADSFDGATWDGTNKTDETITVYPFAADGSLNEDRSMEVIVSLGLESPKAIASGKFVTGLVLGRKLIQVQCDEWDLPDGWGDT